MNLYGPLLYGSLVTIGISGLCIISGVILIKLGYRDAHRLTMLTASSFALIFVALYLK